MNPSNFCIKNSIAKLLMAFVLISIGFIAGKESVLRSGIRGAEKLAQDPADPSTMEGDKVVLYYMHATFRCLTCNSIESMAKEVVETRFSEALADGRLEWQVVNFQENRAMGRHYGVGTSTLVISKIEAGKEVRFQKLDEVWQKVGNPEAFKQFVDDMVTLYLNGEGS
jgi:hypothetical protein